MADYEVLEPGGHAQLVSDIKTYVNRADGVGTTQLADESVTMDKLGEDVIDELDDIVHDSDPLSGNVLFGELAEGTVLTADDAYSAPPKNVEVYGKSTQVSTTGKNLWDEVWENGRIDTSTGEDVYGPAYIRSKNYIPVTPSTTYYCKVGSNSSYWLAIEIYDANKGFIRNLGSILNGATFVAPDNCQYVRFYVSDGYGTTYKNDICVNVSDATFNGTYEPYTGGKPAPSPDYPQPIESVDDLTLVLCGKNLFSAPTWAEISALELDGGYRHWPMHLKPNTTYYVSNTEHDGYTSVGTGTYLLLSPNMQNSQWKSIAHNSSGATSGTITTDSSGIIYLAAHSNTTQTKYENAINGVYTMLTEGSTAVPYEPYVGQSVEIPISNHYARSLPDGTRDTLTLSYIGPSTREGWGVFGAELVQNLAYIDLGTKNWVKDTNVSWNTFYLSFVNIYSADDFDRPLMCTAFKYSTAHSPLNIPDESVAMTNSASTPILRIRSDDYYSQYDATQFKAAVSGVMLQYKLATPIIHDLGTVELPVNPAPDLTAWADGGSAVPTMAMKYERDVNIVIEQLEAQIAELLTS